MLAIAAADAGQRLDRYLCRLLAAMPRVAVFRHLRQGNIRVDGNKAEPSLRLAAGMTIELRVAAGDLAAVAAAPAAAAPPPALPRGDRRRRVDLRIVHADADVLVVDKPPGVASQPGSGVERNHVLALLATQLALPRTAVFEPAPAHRLDRGASGLLAIGWSPPGLRGLVAAFRTGAVTKIYHAVVHGVPEPAAGSIDAPLLQIDAPRRDRPKVVVDVRGRACRTDYAVVARRGDRALLRIELHTGRLHQIRAHLAHLGHPIVGDQRYGSPVRQPDSFLLHATELHLRHPVTGAPLDLVLPLPAAFGSLRAANG